MIEAVYATATFPAQTENGGRVMVQKGSHWSASDPVVRQHPEAFSPDPRYGLQYSQEPAGWDDPPIEQATAAPGEKRQVRRQQ